MPSLSLCLLPLALLAIIHSAAPVEHRVVRRSAPSQKRHLPLTSFIRKRMLESSIIPPPNPGYPDLSDAVPAHKRYDGQWIWMPAHGYMTVPEDEYVEEEEETRESNPNLMRYG